MPLTAVLGYYAAGHIASTTGLRMKKLLIIITCIATLVTAGCSRFHLVHRIDIQQGNVVTQEKVNQLETGMNRNQAQFIMGSPMVVDVFHENRWDYIYYNKPGYGDQQEERTTLFFEDDALVRIDGSLQPSATPVAEDEITRQTTLVVPPQERVAPGLFNKIWHWIRFRSPGDKEF
jgi:outer membrane protein assembly factor BamE